MMRSLRAKITLAFVLTSLLGVVIVAVLVQATTVRAFDTLIRRQQMAAVSERLVEFYRQNGSWDGVEDVIRRAAPGQQEGGAGDPSVNEPAGQGMAGQGRAVPPGYGLVDASGVVLLPVGPLKVGDQAPPDLLRRSSPIVFDGEEVGLIVNDREPPMLTREEELFRDEIGRAVLLAAAGVGAVALVVSVVLGGAVTRPVKEMTAAAEEIASGNLDQEVPVRTKDELGTLARAFNRMSGQLDRANRARERMTADIAHDLRTPLTVISGHLEGLSEGVLRPTRERFELMHRETQSLLRMVQDLRTLSLTDAGELKLYRVPTQVEEILERTMQAHAPAAAAGEVSLSVDCREDVPSVNVDPQRMAQVLDNLVSNALRYTGRGGSIRLEGDVQGGQVLIRVSDTGKGIHPDNLPYVFERFYRSDTARFQKDSESGLGLAIVKGIIDAHGGTISVESAYGEGTEFTIKLPPAA